MLRLRQAHCDACDSRIDRLFTGSVNPVYCYPCMKQIITWLDDIDCLDDHPFGSMIALSMYPTIRYDGWDKESQTDIECPDHPYVQGYVMSKDSYGSMRVRYIRLTKEYRK